MYWFEIYQFKMKIKKPHEYSEVFNIKAQRAVPWPFPAVCGFASLRIFLR